MKINLYTSLATSFRNFATVKIQFGFSDNFFLSRCDVNRFMRARADSITDNSDRYANRRTVKVKSVGQIDGG